jgi:hypothetical protein
MAGFPGLLPQVAEALAEVNAALEPGSPHDHLRTLLAELLETTHVTWHVIDSSINSRRYVVHLPPLDPELLDDLRAAVPNLQQRDTTTTPVHQPLPPARHSKDFRSVHWFGVDHSFTPTQAACVKVLWEAWENATPDLGQETILEHPEVEAESGRLVDLFKGHAAWGTMIVKGKSAGAYRLAEPSRDS